MSEALHHPIHGEAGARSQEASVHMPAPSFWPMVLAFGIALLVAGLVTHYAVSVTGIAIMFFAAFGWWREVIPHEKHIEMPIDQALRPAPIMVEQRSVIRLKVGEGQHRLRVPEKLHPYSAGLWGGLAGGVAMAVLACLYGWFAQRSIWYPVNLLAGVVLPAMGQETVEQLRAFDTVAFFVALVGHGALSLLVGLLYAVMLPMFPRYAPFWAGILMPLIWSGLIGTTLAVLNPALNQRISWPWFIACQLGFGLVGGYIIARSAEITSMQSWGLAERISLHAPGVSSDRENHEG